MNDTQQDNAIRNIKALMKQRKLSQRQLGKLIGVSGSQISLYLTPGGTPLSLSKLEAIANALGVQVDELLAPPKDKATLGRALVSSAILSVVTPWNLAVMGVAAALAHKSKTEENFKSPNIEEIKGDIQKCLIMYASWSSQVSEQFFRAFQKNYANKIDEMKNLFQGLAFNQRVPGSGLTVYEIFGLVNQCRGALQGLIAAKIKENDGAAKNVSYPVKVEMACYAEAASYVEADFKLDETQEKEIQDVLDMINVLVSMGSSDRKELLGFAKFFTDSMA